MILIRNWTINSGLMTAIISFVSDIGYYYNYNNINICKVCLNLRKDCFDRNFCRNMTIERLCWLKLGFTLCTKVDSMRLLTP
ncbi:Uncharacterized protein APZ42_011988 [Daphnia magna]|uniref:Uncharacterized protein n=1 Tax=Daphnia magna TaxID=35525 RepID=A0A162SBC8_9CRUS|nr:Uncharacterized protein APZ42_011988 [Daphnia magna]